MAEEWVPENLIQCEEVFRRGGANLGDEDFALFKCPLCGMVYLLDYEVETVYVDGADLRERVDMACEPLTCVRCHRPIPAGAWVGPKAGPEFRVSWEDLRASSWAWVVRGAQEGGHRTRG